MSGNSGVGLHKFHCNSFLFCFLCTEMEGGLNINISDDRPIEEDMVAMTCYASLWEYRTVNIYYKYVTSDIQFPVQHSNRTMITYNRYVQIFRCCCDI